MASCEYDNERSGSIIGGQFLDQPSDYGLLKKDSGVWKWFVRSVVTWLEFSTVRTQVPGNKLGTRDFSCILYVAVFQVDCSGLLSKFVFILTCGTLFCGLYIRRHTGIRYMEL